MIALSPRLQLGLVAFLWGVSFPIMKLLLESIGTFQLLAVRFGIAALFLYGLSKNKMLHPSSLRFGVKLGVFLFAGYALQTWGLNYTTATHASFIVGSVVVFVALLNYFFKAGRHSKIIILRIVLMTVGLGLLTGMDFQVFLLGDSMQVAAALLFAFQILFVSELPESADVSGIATVQMITVAVLALLGYFLLGPSLGEVSNWSFSAMGWSALIFMGVLATGWTFYAQIVCQRTVKSTETALLLAAEPFWGFIASLIVLGETIAPISAFGGLIVFICSLPLIWRE